MTKARDFGWWMESTDEDVYGPVTIASLGKLLRDGVISANTTVRHCTDAQSAPLVDHGLIDEADLKTAKRSGDSLAESWPRKRAARLALGQSDIQCARHRRPAILTCIRCLAPYCAKCQLKKKRGITHFMCKKCQSSVVNRRFGALMLDGMLINTLPYAAIAIAGGGPGLIYLVAAFGQIGFVFRDRWMDGAGPGKRLFGLRVVNHADGVSPPSYGQSLLRWISIVIPVFVLFDASRAYSDPLQRRYGDSWAKTRVLDAEPKVQKARAKIQKRLQRKGIDFSSETVMSLEEFARIGE